MSNWYEVAVASQRAEADGLTHLELDVAATPLAGTHLHAGQYVKLALEGLGESFFALASPPGPHAARFEVLVKAGAPLADALTQLKPGAQVRATVAQGKGFPLAAARGKNVLLVATGSGLSPVRSAIEAMLAERGAYGELTVYVGARTPQAFAYADRMTHWERAGVRVFRVVSQPGQSGWKGLTGYVQGHLTPPAPPAVAFLCGQKAMVQAVTETLVARGVGRDAIFLNF